MARVMYESNDIAWHAAFKSVRACVEEVLKIHNLVRMAQFLQILREKNAN